MGPAKIPTYLEVGAKRAFAGAVEWPGWCRSGRDEPAALEALDGSARRYAKVLRGTRLGFETPKDATAIRVVERSRVGDRGSGKVSLRGELVTPQTTVPRVP